jgi:hypothetical protein
MQDQFRAAIAADGDFFDWLSSDDNRFFVAPGLDVSGPVMRPRAAPARRQGHAASGSRLRSAS